MRASSPRRTRQVIDRLLRERTAVARSDGTVHNVFPVAVTAAEGGALRDWVIREEATRTIEIGLGYGISALFVCEGLLANGDAAARRCRRSLPGNEVRRLRPSVPPRGGARGARRIPLR